MEKEKFINTGLFMDVRKFLSMFPKETPHQDCTDIVLYKDNHYIQVLKTGLFVYDSFSDKNLEKVEEFLWKKNYKS